MAYISQEEVEVANDSQTGKEKVATATGKGCGQSRNRHDIIAQPHRVSTATE